MILYILMYLATGFMIGLKLFEDPIDDINEDEHNDYSLYCVAYPLIMVIWPAVLLHLLIDKIL